MTRMWRTISRTTLAGVSMAAAVFGAQACHAQEKTTPEQGSPASSSENKLTFPVPAESQPEGWAASRPADQRAAETEPQSGAECWQGLQWERYTLANGTPVLAVHVDGAARQALFDFQPIGLIDDKPAQAQYAHLLEHMLIRSTERGRLNTWGLEINGETTAQTMRLEIFADESRWDEALEKQTMWLREGQLDWKNLDGEKNAIAMEEQTTAASGFTNKFALAAWNQIVRQGLKEAHVHGDAQGGAIEPVLDMVHARRAVGPQMMIGAIGPMDLKDVRETLGKTFGALHAVQATRPAGMAKNSEILKDFRAQWDMPTKHMMRWWKVGEVSAKRIRNLSPAVQKKNADASTQADAATASRPDEEREENVRKNAEPSVETRLRAAALCAGRAIRMKLQTSSAVNDGSIRNVLVFGGLETSDGELLIMVDCCIRDDANEAEVWKDIDVAAQFVAGDGNNDANRAATANATQPGNDSKSLGDQGREKEWVEQGDNDSSSHIPHAEVSQEKGERMMRMCAGMYAIEMGSVPDFEQAKAHLPNAKLRDFFEGNWLLGRCYIEFEWGVPFEQALEAIQHLDGGMITHVQDSLRSKGGKLVLRPIAK
ncbi:MAG TPA: hypothetical protein VG711_12830 [Phycisphaerales bacterium]|nr:hypothetical protein [Phycisphaerales bacterium]